MSKVLDKRDYYRRAKRLEFGNVLGQWDWEEFLASDEDGVFGMRDKRPGSSPLFKRRLSRKGVIAYVRKLLREGKIEPSDVLISNDTSLADNSRTLQGELWLEAGKGLAVVFSRISGCDTCREEMRQPNLTTFHGMRAYAALREYMDANSFDNAMELMRKFPDSVVEFTCFGIGVGLLGWNTVFWEVRNY